MLTEKDIRRINSHDYYINGVINNPVEGLIFGNGDIGGFINTYSNELRITLGKNDIWDARLDNITEKNVLKHDDLIRYEKENGLEFPVSTVPKWEKQPEGVQYYFESRAYWLNPYFSGPCPKRAGNIRIVHPGLSNTQVETKMDIAKGITVTTFAFPKGKLTIEAFIHKNENRIRLKISAEGNPPWFQIILEKEPDDTDYDMPKPELVIKSKNKGAVGQVIPSGCDVDEFKWHFAGIFPDTTNDKNCECYKIDYMAYRIVQFCRLDDGQSITFSAGIATSRDGSKNTMERAFQIAGNNNNEAYLNDLKSHIELWETFWSASMIELDDKEYESVWYRNLFDFAAHLKPGAQAPGNSSNVTVFDCSPWHGDYHWNHNVQKWYTPALPTNHPEWLDVYADLIDQMMPKFAYMAELIFDLEGVYCDLATFPYVPAHRTFVNNVYGRALGVTGWVGQALWWHWEYTNNKEWLRKRAYPYIKKAAQFYYRYMKKYQNEELDIFPSIRLEEPSWQKGFEHNRNVITDLVMFRNAFNWAINASEILDVDFEWREKWKEAIKKVPEIEYGWTEDGQGWINLDKNWKYVEPNKRATDARLSRWGGNGWIVFPGEYIQGDEDIELVEVMKDMLKRNNVLKPFGDISKDIEFYTIVPFIHSIAAILPSIRLDLKEKYDSIRELILKHRFPSGQLSVYPTSIGEIPRTPESYLFYQWRPCENNQLGIVAITEMLMQSQGGIIRLFPYLPENMCAEFRDLRARGGFLVSAKKHKDGKINVKIQSQAGTVCRIKWQYKDIPAVYRDDKEVEVERFDKGFYFNTDENSTYFFEIEGMNKIPHI